MATPYFKGSAYVLLGDPTQANGAGMIDLGETFQVEIDPGPSASSAGEPGGAQLSDSVQQRASSPVITVTYHKQEAPLMKALYSFINDESPEGELLLTDATRYIDPKTLCIVPVNEKESAVTSKDVWWFPAVHTTGAGGWSFSDNEGTDAQSNMTDTLQSTKRYTDQAGQDIPEGKRVGYRGAALPGWSLPADYTGA